MGWTFYTPTHYKRSGTHRVIDRKAECDDLFTQGGTHTVLKSSMYGSIYYAAVSIDKKLVDRDKTTNKPVYETIPPDERQIFAAIVLTSVQNGDFGYKDMDETCGPIYTDCPIGILDLLTETTSKSANEWREACRKKRSEKNSNSLSKLPIGTVIRFMIDGETVTLTKMSPKYQFKTPWWYNSKDGTYVKKKHIPNNYEIVRQP